jgi:translation initiation factor 3 subunit J
MTDNWDDSDDEWDVDDDALDAKLGIKKKDDFDDEEDLALQEKDEAEKSQQADLKKKGSALQIKKQAEKDRKEELEIARKAMELEAELEEKMSPDERRAMERQRIEDADHELTDDLFGAVDKMAVSSASMGAAQQAGDKVVMKDMKDHMKHARKVSDCMKVSKETGVDDSSFVDWIGTSGM